METVDQLANQNAGDDQVGDGGGEKGRLDRELVELLNELRVVLPGVQALFAFLLIVPFSAGFADATGMQKVVYTVALLSSAVAGVLFITAPAFHRFRFRRHDKAQLLRIGNRSAIAGLAALAVAMVASFFLIAEYLFGARVGIVLAAVIAVPMVILWWLVPVALRPDHSRR